jgi:GNAT superfamily N-acetyltransferase
MRLRRARLDDAEALERIRVRGWQVACRHVFPPRELDAMPAGLYVDPDCWGRGAGRALLERAEVELAQRSDEAVLWTLEHNPRTRRFYEANGWHVDGMTGSFESFGVEAPIMHYAKRLSSSTSRS